MQLLGHEQVSTADEIRCSKGQVLLAGLPHPVQLLHGNYSPFGNGQDRYQCPKIGEKSYRLGSHCNWSSYRMSFNILEKADMDSGYVENLLINMNNIKK